MLQGRRDVDEALKNYGDYKLPVNGYRTSEDFYQLVQYHILDVIGVRITS